MRDDTDLECPECGALAPGEATRCPQCGLSFYPQEEAGIPAASEKSSSGTLQRVITLLLIAGIIGSGGVVLLGAGWLWLVLTGALVFGLLGWWFWDR